MSHNEISMFSYVFTKVALLGSNLFKGVQHVQNLFNFYIMNVFKFRVDSVIGCEMCMTFCNSMI